MYQFKHIELCYSSINNLRSVSLIKEYSGFFFVLQAAVGADVVGERPAARTQPNPTISFPPRPLFFRRGLIVSNATRHDATREKVKSSSSGGATKPTSTKIFSPPLLSSPPAGDPSPPTASRRHRRGEFHSTGSPSGRLLQRGIGLVSFGLLPPIESFLPRLESNPFSV